MLNIHYESAEILKAPEKKNTILKWPRSCSIRCQKLSHYDICPFKYEKKYQKNRNYVRTGLAIIK